MSRLVNEGCLFRLVFLFILTTMSGEVRSAGGDSDKSKLVVRVEKPLSDKALREFTSVVDARSFDEKNFPDLKVLTSRQIVNVLCGSFRAAYWDQFVRINSLDGANIQPDRVIGERGYSLKWPGCPYVAEAPKVKYVVKPGDTAFDVYKRLTGTAGGTWEIKQYFKASGVKNLARLKPGQALQPSHVSAPKVMTASLDAAQFRETFANLAYVSAIKSPTLGNDTQDAASDNEERAAQQSNAKPFPAARFEIAAGRIEAIGTRDYDSRPFRISRSQGWQGAAGRSCFPELPEAILI
ncbi:hypothetical protein BVER_03882 [Candidatus Burkholderia verschuerenii]|uniref:LysM domain-containing protein n=1 Tax=Candidatus Burkholderia verschuerenii TaxID=242163 RepID=A0A0L0MDS2_9BURK|nr:hypothetical protein [Candidatus Burkholderia verschuerenii]KND60425.1 hypothetical protein BVER_03882 [Candidatus Burkholderia verschuerenii]